jgi:sialate O-acetylesterase
MNHVFGRSIIFVLTLSALLVPQIRADVKLPSVFGRHMVLQRNQPLPIWGTASPGEDIGVQLGANSAKTKADDKGAWKVTLPAMKADGKAHTLIVVGKNKIELEDILIGEVWVGSGQSNMEWSLAQSHDAKEAIPAADKPRIRLFQVPLVQTPKPASDVKAKWEVCTPKTVGRFSGVLYHFGLRLHNELDVPIGLINSSWGGSPIEPWTVTDKSSGGMYNGMIAPLQPFALRGVCWYQGETNVIQKNGMKYRDKMEALISGWRKTWGQELSFYHVQIAPWTGYAEGELPALWEAQAASLKIPKTGMVVMTDLVPNLGDIHPNNKRDVGNRLALWALAKDYGKKDLVYSGPLYKSLKVEADKIRLSFAYAGGLKARDGKALSEFQIAGADGKFVAASAVIDGESVVVSAKDVAAPTQVRFGWHKLANPNLVKNAGLPASPFQTNNWQGATGE